MSMLEYNNQKILSMKLKIIIMIIVGLSVVSIIIIILSVFAYVDWGLQHPELGNTRDIWIGHFQDAFFIIRFDNECYYEFMDGWIPMGDEHVVFFTDNVLDIPKCSMIDGSET